MKPQQASERRFTRESEIWEIVEGFRNRKLAKHEWGHSAHLVVALVYCRHFPIASVLRFLRDEIRVLNDAHGVANTSKGGYHETLTVFWIGHVSRFVLESSDTEPLVGLANRLLDECGDPSLPLKFYTKEILFSAAARKRYVRPDLNTNI